MRSQVGQALRQVTTGHHFLSLPPSPRAMPLAGSGSAPGHDNSPPPLASPSGAQSSRVHDGGMDVDGAGTSSPTSPASSAWPTVVTAEPAIWLRQETFVGIVRDNLGAFEEGLLLRAWFALVWKVLHHSPRDWRQEGNGVQLVLVRISDALERTSRLARELCASACELRAGPGAPGLGPVGSLIESPGLAGETKELFAPGLRIVLLCPHTSTQPDRWCAHVVIRSAASRLRSGRGAPVACHGGRWQFN